MIELHSINKKFNDRYVLKNIDLTFPRYGLVIINGPSGCGKTTLLNSISTLLDFDGDISFDGKHYSISSVSDKELIRSQKIGFVFQDYKLFSFETVYDNIRLSLDISSGDKKAKKDKRISDLLAVVGLANKKNELVTNLSGGEKQRVAIARAIANSPTVLLADEPTGNLDEFNTERIMELLQKISSSSLVIMVSHDKELTEKYADEIVYINDGKIVDVIYQNHNVHHQYLPVINLNYRSNKRLLPFSFLFKHTINSIKRRRWRTLFITFITSLGLIGVGLASTLSNIISSNLNRSYSSILDDDRLVLSNKEIDTSRDIVTSASYDEVMNLYQNNQEDIDYVGVYYASKFEKMFDYDVVSVEGQGSIKPIPGLSLKLVNEFDLLRSDLDIRPNKLTNLENNQVVLSGPFAIVNEICFQLKIERTLDSFYRYLSRNSVYLTFTVSNSSWSYGSDFSIELKGFILSNVTCLYHSNVLWNEYILETKLTLSSTNYLNVNSQHPWDLKKGYFLSFNKNRDNFIKNYRFSINYSSFDFEILDKKYLPILYSNSETFECPRVLIIKRTNKDYVPSFVGEICKQTSKYVKSVIYGSSSGYAIYDKSLMVGFAKNSFISFNESNIEDVIDLLSYVKYENSQSIVLPKGTIEGHFSKSNQDGFVFEPNYRLISGRRPLSFQEIVVSDNLLDKLNISDPINKNVYFTFPVAEALLTNGYISRDFVTVSLKIVGVSNSGKLALHHDESWSLLFFQTMLGVSCLDLNVENFALQIDKSHETDVIKKLTRAFPQYQITSPLKDVRDSVDEICRYIELILLVVSISSVLIASLILFICNYLHFLEAKKDIGLVRCLGSKKSESKKFIYFHSFIMTGLSLLLSISELLIISFVLSKSLSKSLHISSQFVFNPMSIVYMLVVGILISFISSILISRRIAKIDPLDCLR